MIGKHIISFNCNKRGHKIADCHTRQADLRYDSDSAEKGSPHAMMFEEEQGRKSTCLVDSGAGHDICRDRHLFASIEKIKNSVRVIIGDGASLMEVYKGTFKLIFRMYFVKNFVASKKNLTCQSPHSTSYP